MRRDSHIIVRDRVAQHREPFVRREEGLLLIVNRYRDDDFVKSVQARLDDIEMTIRHGIKAAGINRASHDRKRSERFGLHVQP